MKCSSTLLLFALLFCQAIPQVRAQEDTEEEAQYREDYERVQAIMKTTETARRADQLLLFLRERPNSKIADYAQENLFQILESYLKAENNSALLRLSESYIKTHPRVGETYYFYGAALKNVDRVKEAMDALAKCYVIKNRASAKAKEFLDYLYKQQNRGSLAGQDAIIKKARAEVNK